LFTYCDEAVSRSEFWRVFGKNNPRNANPTEQEIRDYLQLYINFKLKVREAKLQQVDTIPAVRSKLQTYRAQLVNSYVDKEVLDSLVRQTYERQQKDILIGHIQIAIPGAQTPADTMGAFTKAMEARKLLLLGNNFHTVAEQYSTDTMSVKKGGDMVYLTSLMHPFYNLEDAMYRLPVGGVSMPIRTRLGYHVMQVFGSRPAAGRMEAAHILISSDGTPAQDQRARKTADSLYRVLKADTSAALFAELAAKYSDDERSANTGGRLGPFGTGGMIHAFDVAAFSLKADGEISEPVKTYYGYHIIKRLSHKPIYPFTDIEQELRTKVTQDARYTEAKKDLIAKYKADYGFIQFPGNEQVILPLMDTTVYKAQWKPSERVENKELFRLENRSFTTVELVNYIVENQRKQRFGTYPAILQRHYDGFIEQSVTEYGLSKRYEDFEYLRQEYRDGIMLFALTERTVWKKATDDTAGLREFYNQHVGKYMADAPRAHWLRITAVNKKIAKYAAKLAKQGLADNPLMDTLTARRTYIFTNLYGPTQEEIASMEQNPQSFPITHFVRQERGKYTQPGENTYLDDVQPWKVGITKVKPVYDTITLKNLAGGDSLVIKTKYQFFRIHRVLKPGPKELEESKGYYIADYQDHLEKEWIAELRRKCPAIVNEQVLQTLFR
jgi:peptidyl-prolyl cis-trans isomerase SurA